MQLFIWTARLADTFAALDPHELSRDNFPIRTPEADVLCLGFMGYAAFVGFAGTTETQVVLVYRCTAIQWIVDKVTLFLWPRAMA